MARITVDPITRIEGHLRVDVEVNGGKVTNAWSSAQMYRGIETILQGRDPRDAWLFTQRFCGVCTTVHALASVRTVEDAYNIEVPINAQYLRNIVSAAHTIQDNVVHFYHLSALDWVDIVSALDANPAEAERIAQSYSNWHGNTTIEFAAAKARLKAFVDSGNLGIYGSGYWGHPAMKLPPAVNLIGFTHYLKALEYQRKASQIVALIGGKDPHIQNLCVGGVATAINVDNTATLNMERIAYMQSLIVEIQDFVKNVYLPDVIAIGAHYPEWFSYGAGVTNYLSVPEHPIDSKNSKFLDIGGTIRGGDLSTFRKVDDWNDKGMRDKITESTVHAWYKPNPPQHPYVGTCEPAPGSWVDDGQYSWCKAPRYGNEAFQVGPLAQILAAYAAGDNKTIKMVNDSLSLANTISGANLTAKNLHSTLGRHLARSIRVVQQADRVIDNINLLTDNLAKGDQTYANPIHEFPKGEFRGAGFYEAARGMLSHWVVIQDGKIANYQCVVPSTWNAGPRDEQGAHGPYEASLIDNPIADEAKPLEVIRTIHSFDPCIACAVHTVDPEGKEITKIKVN